jgi:hypothetical protein
MSFFLLLGVLLLGGALYFLPTIVGRYKRNSRAIFVLNLFLGWTLLGWVAALVWAMTIDTEAIIMADTEEDTPPSGHLGPPA